MELQNIALKFDSYTEAQFGGNKKNLYYNADKVKEPTIYFDVFYIKGIEPQTIKHKFITCKEVFTAEISKKFRDAKGFKDICFVIECSKDSVVNMVNFIHKYEKQALKVNEQTVFKTINGVPELLYIVPSRRWLRSPQSTYIFLSILKLADFYDDTIDLEKNLARIKSLADKNNSVSQFSQYSKCHWVFERILKEGFQGIYKPSRHFGRNWFLGESTEGHISFGSLGQYTLYTDVENYKISNDTNSFNDKLRSYYRPYRDSFLLSIFPKMMGQVLKTKDLEQHKIKIPVEQSASSLLERVLNF